MYSVALQFFVKVALLGCTLILKGINFEFSQVNLNQNSKKVSQIKSILQYRE